MGNMHSIILWLKVAFTFMDRHQGALLVIFTCGVAILTAFVAFSTYYYARLTAALVRETTLLREIETEPLIAVYLMPEDRWISLIDIVVKNHGRGSAQDITWEFVADDETKSRYAELLRLPFFRDYLTFLPARNFVGSLEAPWICLRSLGPRR